MPTTYNADWSIPEGYGRPADEILDSGTTPHYWMAVPAGVEYDKLRGHENPQGFARFLIWECYPHQTAQSIAVRVFRQHAVKIVDSLRLLAAKDDQEA